MKPEVEILVLPLYVLVEILVLPLYEVESVDLFAALLVMGAGDNRLYFFKSGVRRNLNSR